MIKLKREESITRKFPSTHSILQRLMKISYRISVLNIASIALLGYIAYIYANQITHIGKLGATPVLLIGGIIAAFFALAVDQIFQSNIRSKARLFVIEIGLIMLCARGVAWWMEHQ